MTYLLYHDNFLILTQTAPHKEQGDVYYTSQYLIMYYKL